MADAYGNGALGPPTTLVRKHCGQESPPYRENSRKTVHKTGGAGSPDVAEAMPGTAEHAVIVSGGQN